MQSGMVACSRIPIAQMAGKGQKGVAATTQSSRLSLSGKFQASWRGTRRTMSPVAAACNDRHNVTPANDISRRAVVQASGLSLLLAGMGPRVAVAEEEAQKATDTKVYFDLSIDGKPEGRVVIQVFSDSPISDQRFSDLSKGKMGVGYRRSKVDSVNESFIRFDGVASLTYSSSQESPIAGGEDFFKLEDEMAASTRKHTEAGLVSLVVKDLTMKAPKEKLVAMGGKLVNVKEEVGAPPNGTGFVITVDSAPELDATNLVVGKVVEGLDIVREISKLPAVKDNTMSPFFMAAKAIGDKRADVAETGFNKPYSKIVVTKSGIL